MTEREIPDHRREHYEATIVAIFHDGEVVEARDLAGRLGTTIHVITAWNPGAERPRDDENRRRNEALRADLAEVTNSVLPALGVSTEDGHPAEPHSEASWAVVGLNRDIALALGARYDQDAIFEITETTQEVVPCPSPPSVPSED